ncbi:hypothetical protein [Calidithermus chliarophilus]|uniref:hypothetical protein n=1 Tax=Calidithermus chliarophilus TaxID=52023 RepID=UPI0003FDAD90|nr:hypothetical protein [Calidithermus chliarophilus]
MQPLVSKFLDSLNGKHHRLALVLFMVVATAHFLEHVCQITQIHVLGWPAKQAGGILGLLLPQLAASEVLHSSWNTLQLAGLLLLQPGFRGRGRAFTFWTAAIAVQIWHWLEHALLQAQYLSGYYLFGKAKQTSVLELFFPRADLHFTYNLLVFTPTVIALVLYLLERRRAAKARQSSWG